ncbi:TetR/AcrR family transcriptional regulator [Pseudomaricurvus alkylphenolicus]|uniref:TetR/AcrR family transcriptional regulator n=1 Tax=Pseudomaricurvus alkylphenolicus TaxID=1306991 RepID=UPI001422B653|nr:TetR/AcrR family transcriptional regulator [Pseudomaricurvus alkylphenolicus]NIB42297.1 TetR/AcrR family transcriptional regulator [Pseudomaricurvus alkylphenolicus]
MTAVAPTKATRSTGVKERQRKATINALMVAAIEMLYEEGYAAMTMAKVAKRAGVSRGALNHYYSTKDQLVISAAQYVMGLEMKKVEEAALEADGREEAVDAFFDASERFFLSERYIAMLELLLAARNEPYLAEEYFPLVDRFRKLFDDRWKETLTKSGISPEEADELIDITNLTLRGLSFALVKEPGRVGLDEKLTHLRKQLRQLAKIGS